MYNIRYDLEFGIGKDVVRNIPCAYSFCIERLDLSWDKNEKVTNQKRYSVNKKCLNGNIFEGLNDWNIITLVIQTKNKNCEKDDETFKIILRGL